MKLSPAVCIDAQGHSTKTTSCIYLPRPLVRPRISTYLSQDITLPLASLLTLPTLLNAVGTPPASVIVDDSVLTLFWRFLRAQKLFN